MSVEHKGDNVLSSVDAAREWAVKHSANKRTLEALDHYKREDGLILHDPLLFANIVLPGPSAPDITASQIETSCLLHRSQLEQLKQLCANLKPLTRTKQAVWTVRRSKDTSRGYDKGLYASVAISIGTVILEERPFIISPLLVPLSDSQKSKSDIYKDLIQRLPEHQRSQMMQLKNCKSAEDCGEEEGLIRTNGIGITLSLGAEPFGFNGVFDSISRCNHSCSPNATLHWDVHTLSMSLISVRPIDRDEEITISYVSPLEPVKARLAALKASYNFGCKCTSCKSSSTDTSDKNRNTILAWIEKGHVPRFTKLPKLIQAGTATKEKADTIQAATSKMLDRIKTEGLECLQDSNMRILDSNARLKGAFGDEAAFIEATKKAREVWVVSANLSSAARNRVTTYDRWIDDPSSFSHWELAKDLPSVPSEPKGKKSVEES